MDNIIIAATRLIYLACGVTNTPSNNLEYRALLARYRATPEMQQVVMDMATGQDLKILDVSERGLIIAPSGKESRFSLRLGDLRAKLNENQKSALALSFLAICAQFYPTTAMIEDDSRFAMPATLDMFSERLRGIVERMHSQEDSEEYSREELRPGWSYLHGLPISLPGTERAAPSSIDGFLRMALKYLNDYGLVNVVGSQDNENTVEYTPTHRLRIQVRERTLPQLFDYVRSTAV